MVNESLSPYPIAMNIDPFFVRMPNREIACGDSGYFLKLTTGRDGDTLSIRHETKVIGSNLVPHSTILCFCSSSRRRLNDQERTLHAADTCPDVVLWAVVWSPSDDDREIEGLGNKREFLERFFRFYQTSDGFGCHVEGKCRSALVEVAFGTAWYGTCH